MAEINDSDDIIKILFDYVKNNFDNFGHRRSRFFWWWETRHWWMNPENDFGSSWSPFVEACFIEAGKKYPNYEIFCSLQNSEQLKNYMGASYRHPNPKKSDIDFFDKNANKFVLSLEHSEDSPQQKQIDNYKGQIGWQPTDDQDVEGDKTKKQLIAVRQEVWKLKGKQLQLNSKFKVVISRPKCFDKINGKKEKPSYFDSVKYFRNQIEKDLKKDVASLNDNENWLIILIAPNNGSLYANVDEILFYCYEWDNKKKCLNDSQITHIPVKKKDDNKWVINNESPISYARTFGINR